MPKNTAISHAILSRFCIRAMIFDNLYTYVPTYVRAVVGHFVMNPLSAFDFRIGKLSCVSFLLFFFCEEVRVTAISLSVEQCARGISADSSCGSDVLSKVVKRTTSLCVAVNRKRMEKVQREILAVKRKRRDDGGFAVRGGEEKFTGTAGSAIEIRDWKTAKSLK